MSRLPFDIDTSDLEEHSKNLQVFFPKSFPHITRDTLNNAAFITKKRAQAIVKRRMVLKNTWTMRSIQVEKAQGIDVRNMEARIGSTMEYMAKQEFGDTISKKGKKGLGIPTTIASREGEGARPRRKVVRKPLYMKQIRLLKTGVKSKSKRQFIVASIMAAAKRGGRNRFIYLPFERHPGIYMVTGGKKKPKIKLVYDLSRKSIIIPPSPWLSPASDRGARAIPKLYEEATIRNLKKVGIL